MPLKTESAEEPSLNLTPMIDVVFLLIIFFMVGTQFAQQERQFDVQLPTVSDAPPLTGRPDPITINVPADGTIRVDDRTLTVPELAALLEKAKANYADQAVIVRGAGAVRYQHVAEVLAVCHQAGIRIVSQAVRLDEEPSP